MNQTAADCNIRIIAGKNGAGFAYVVGQQYPIEGPGDGSRFETYREAEQAALLAKALAELNKPACTDENGTWHNPDDLRDLAGHGATIIQLSDELAACHEARNIQADTIVRLVGALKAIAGHVKGPMNNVAHLQATARAALSQVQA